MPLPASLRRALPGAVAPLSLLALSALATPAAFAQTPASTPIIDFTGGRTFVVSGASSISVVGFDFTVSSTQIITGLGVFDVGNNGLVNSHSVGLFDSNNALLSSVEVTTANSTAVASTSTLGNYRRVALLNAITLTAGQRYLLGATYASSDPDYFVGASSATGAPGFTFGTNRSANSSTLVAPTDAFDFLNAGFFGPMAFTGGATAAAAPEPGTIALLMTAGIPMVGIVRRRKKVAATA